MTPCARRPEKHCFVCFNASFRPERARRRVITLAIFLLRQLATAAVSDRSAPVDARFCAHLRLDSTGTRAHTVLSILVPTLNDESFDNRLKAVSLLGRLSRRNQHCPFHR